MTKFNINRFLDQMNAGLMNGHEPVFRRAPNEAFFQNFKGLKNLENQFKPDDKIAASLDEGRTFHLATVTNVCKKWIQWVPDGVDTEAYEEELDDKKYEYIQTSICDESDIAPIRKMIKEKRLQAPVHYYDNKDDYYQFVEESLIEARVAPDECFKYLDPAFRPNKNRFIPGMVLENLCSTKDIGEAVDKNCQLALSIVTKVKGDYITYCNMNDEIEVSTVYYSRTLFPVGTYRELSLKRLKSIEIDKKWRQMILDKCWPKDLPRRELNVEDIEDNEYLEETSDSDQETSDNDQETLDNDSDYAPSDVTSSQTTIEEHSKSNKCNRPSSTSNEFPNPKRPVRNVRKSIPLFKDGQLVHGTLSKNNLSIDDNRKRLAFEEACRRSGPGSSGFKAPMLLQKSVVQGRNPSREAPTTTIPDIVNQNGEDQTTDLDDPHQTLRDFVETRERNHQLKKNYKKRYEDVLAYNKNYLSQLSKVGGLVPPSRERESQEQNEESPYYYSAKLKEELAYAYQLTSYCKQLLKQEREIEANLNKKKDLLEVPLGRVPHKRPRETDIGNEEDTAMDFPTHPPGKKGCRNELNTSH